MSDGEMASIPEEEVRQHYGERTPNTTGRDRLMAVCLVLAVVVLIDGVASFVTWRSGAERIEANRRRGDERAALQCILLDGPYGQSALPSVCTRPEILRLVDQYEREMTLRPEGG